MPETSPSPVLRMAQVSKAYGATRALDGVTFELGRGEVHALLGENGAGKSTMMKVLSGAVAPDSGRMFLDGRPYVPSGPLDGLRSGISMIYQELNLAPHLTVEENISFGPRMRGTAEREWRGRVEEMLRLVGLVEHRTKLPRELSGGMKQRVQIARVLANDPDIILMDEPFAALDAYTRGRMQKEVTRIWSALRRTALFVTHDIAEAIWLADRIGIMTRGPESRIREVFEVTLPRPRERMTSGFIDLFNSLSEVIDVEAGNVQ